MAKKDNESAARPQQGSAVVQPLPQAAAQDNAQQQVQLHVAPELEYCYRDLFSVFVGMEEVVIEFGNRHRSLANRGTINNRIVLSIPNAFRLQQVMAQTLQNARQRIQAAAQAAQQEAADGQQAGA